MNSFNHFSNSDLRIIELLERINNNGIKIINDFWEDVIIQGAGGFFGAFFAFIFGLLTFWINKKRERFFLHKNAVVELEYLLNDHLNFIAKNEYLTIHTVKILKRRYYTYNKLQLFRLPDDLELRLGDLDVINRYFDYRESLVRLNSDFEKANRAFENLSNFALTQGIPPHERNFTHLIEQLNLLNKFLFSLLDEVKELLAYVRIYLRRLESFKEKGIRVYKLNRYSRITEKEIKKELKTLEKEIRKTMQESQEKIKKTLG